VAARRFTDGHEEPGYLKSHGPRVSLRPIALILLELPSIALLASSTGTARRKQG
jgi:hypothetical protein